MTPKIFAFEGTDGVGKTTLAAKVHEQLQHVGIRSELLPEFGNNIVGRLISGRVSDQGFWSLGDAPAENHACLLVLLADYLLRLANIERATDVVLADRYLLSLLECQWSPLVENGYADSDVSSAILALTRTLPTPATTYILQVPPDERLRRLKSRGDQVDSEILRTLDRRDEWRISAIVTHQDWMGRTSTVDASLPQDAVLSAIIDDMSQVLGRSL